MILELTVTLLYFCRYMQGGKNYRHGAIGHFKELILLVVMKDIRCAHAVCLRMP